MARDDAAFISEIDGILGHWLQQIEDRAEDIDADLHDGVLSLRFEDGRVAILNRHVPLHQLWYSSPLSGASHYSYDAPTRRWRNTRGGADLRELLNKELSDLLGIMIELKP